MPDVAAVAGATAIAVTLMNAELGIALGIILMLYKASQWPANVFSYSPQVLSQLWLWWSGHSVPLEAAGQTIARHLATPKGTAIWSSRAGGVVKLDTAHKALLDQLQLTVTRLIYVTFGPAALKCDWCSLEGDTSLHTARTGSFGLPLWWRDGLVYSMPRRMAPYLIAATLIGICTCRHDKYWVRYWAAVVMLATAAADIVFAVSAIVPEQLVAALPLFSRPVTLLFVKAHLVRYLGLAAALTVSLLCSTRPKVYQGNGSLAPQSLMLKATERVTELVNLFQMYLVVENAHLAQNDFRDRMGHAAKSSLALQSDALALYNDKKIYDKNI